MSYIHSNELGVPIAPIAAGIAQAVPFFAKLFGGQQGPSYAERRSAARGLAQQGLSQLDLPQVIKTIEAFIQQGTIYNCGHGESTHGRACVIQPCYLAKKLGWTNAKYGNCDPLMKEPLTFGEMETLLMPFFQQKLPELKAELAKQKTPQPSTTTRPPIAQPSPAQSLMVIQQPQPLASEPQIIQEAGIAGGPLLWVALAVGAGFFLTQLAEDKPKSRRRAR